MLMIKRTPGNYLKKYFTADDIIYDLTREVESLKELTKKPQPFQKTLSINPGAHGTINLYDRPQTVYLNMYEPFVLSILPFAGYSLSTVSVNGVHVDPLTKFSLFITKDYSVSATFVKNRPGDIGTAVIGDTFVIS